MDLHKRTVIAHRGASALVEFENTLEAFEKAIELGVPIMEFDVRVTKDNVFVSYHDDSIDNKKINEVSFIELQSIATSKGFRVPTILDILVISKNKIILDIELKETGYEEELILLVKSHLSHEEFFMKSFIDESIIEIKKIDSRIKTGLLLGVDIPKNGLTTRLSEIFPLRRIIKAKPDFISPHYELLKWGFINRMKFHNLPIYVWTVNDEYLMQNLFSKGVTSIITDRPDIALKYI